MIGLDPTSPYPWLALALLLLAPVTGARLAPTRRPWAALTALLALALIPAALALALALPADRLSPLRETWAVGLLDQLAMADDDVAWRGLLGGALPFRAKVAANLAATGWTALLGGWIAGLLTDSRRVGLVAGAILLLNPIAVHGAVSDADGTWGAPWLLAAALAWATWSDPRAPGWQLAATLLGSLALALGLGQVRDDLGALALVPLVLGALRRTPLARVEDAWARRVGTPSGAAIVLLLLAIHEALGRVVHPPSLHGSSDVLYVIEGLMPGRMGLSGLPPWLWSWLPLGAALLALVGVLAALARPLSTGGLVLVPVAWWASWTAGHGRSTIPFSVGEMTRYATEWAPWVVLCAAVGWRVLREAPPPVRTIPALLLLVPPVPLAATWAQRAAADPVVGIEPGPPLVPPWRHDHQQALAEIVPVLEQGCAVITLGVPWQPQVQGPPLVWRALDPTGGAWHVTDDPTLTPASALEVVAERLVPEAGCVRAWRAVDCDADGARCPAFDEAEPLQVWTRPPQPFVHPGHEVHWTGETVTSGWYAVPGRPADP